MKILEGPMRQALALSVSARSADTFPAIFNDTF